MPLRIGLRASPGTGQVDNPAAGTAPPVVATCRCSSDLTAQPIPKIIKLTCSPPLARSRRDLRDGSTTARTSYADLLAWLHFSPAEMKMLTGIPLRGWELGVFIALPALATLGVLVASPRHFGHSQRDLLKSL